MCDTEGNGPAHADVDEDESRDDKKTCLAEGEREPKARGGANAGSSAVCARGGTRPLGESLPEKDTQYKEVTECKPYVTLVCRGKRSRTRRLIM